MNGFLCNSLKQKGRIIMRNRNYRPSARRRMLNTNSNRRSLNCGESYGWVVDSREAQEAYDFACEVIGKEQVDSDIVGTLSYDDLSDALAFLFRMWDFEEWEKYKNGEDW